jgi:hypothetical protein
LENLVAKRKEIINVLRTLENDYQSIIDVETHNEELKNLPDRIKEIQKLLTILLNKGVNNSGETTEINRLLGRFQEICRKTEEFIQNRPPTPPVISPKSQEEKQESPTEHSENPKDESPKDQKNHGSKPLIFLLIIAVVALLSIPPLYYFFSEKGKRKQIQIRKRKTSQLTTF